MSSSLQFSALQTVRLKLRQLSDGDQEKIIQLRSDAEVHKYLERPLLRKPGEAIEFINRINDGIARGEWYYWVISLITEGTLLGTVCLFNFSADQKVAEVGYELLPQHQGKGYMNEALQAVIDFAFQKLSLKQIDAFSHRENSASLRLLQKKKFKADPANDKAEDPFLRYYLKAPDPEISY